MNFEIIENLDVSQVAEDSRPQPAPRRAWFKPTIMRIGLKRTLLDVGSGDDGISLTSKPGP